MIWVHPWNTNLSPFLLPLVNSRLQKAFYFQVYLFLGFRKEEKKKKKVWLSLSKGKNHVSQRNRETFAVQLKAHKQNMKFKID